MKNLIKLLILIVVLSIFTFSSNQTITKIRNFSSEKGKIVYEFLVDKLSKNENETIVNIINKIK